MTPFDSGLPPLWETIGFLVGGVLSLLILSFVIRDSWLVRAAQYLLVGITLAYTVVLLWSNVLWPRLFSPLLTTPLSLFGGRDLTSPLWTGWLPLLMGLLLWAAGVEHLFGREKSGRRAWLRHLAAAPLALLMGVGVGVGIAGAIQGTLLPQFNRATALDFGSAAPLLLVGLLTLLITGGALLHLQLGEAAGRDSRFPKPLRPLLAGWAWLGERSLWLAAGVLFARLFASRITLLIARLDGLLFSHQTAELWRWLTTFGQGG